MTEKSKIYTGVDFERYHSGAMPVNEMHELEKAALEDPFLADALEGYSYTPSFENDIIELKEKLDERRKKKNVFSIFSLAQSGWWRIAALVIVITGAGYFFYKLNYKEKENTLAKNEIKLSPSKKDSTSVNNDTVTTTSDVALENQNNLKAEQKKKSISNETNVGSKKDILNGHFKKEPSSVSDSIRFNSKENYALNEKNETSKNQPDKNSSDKYLLKGKVIDESGKPLAFATIKNKNRNEATVTDTSGHFLLASPDSNTKAIVSVSGYEAKLVTLQKDKEPVIAMNQSESNLDEVVVTGYAQKKKSSSTGSKTEKLNGRVSGVEIKSQDTTVLSNNEKFDQYLKANIKPVSDESDTLLAGEVFLSFTINKKGNPRNIKVIKSSCKECEAKAIRLLENGPRWTIEKQKLKTVLIKF